MLYFGTLGGIAAAAAGIYASYIVPHGEAVHEIMEQHEHLMLTVVGLALLLSVWRLAVKQPPGTMAKTLYYLLAAIMTGCMVFGADLGGFMVYGNGVAVQQLQMPESHHHHD